MSDEDIRAEGQGGAADGGGGGDSGALADGEDDGEAAIFADISGERAKGTRFDAMADGNPAGDGKPAGDGAGDGKPAGAGEGAADGKPAGDGAGDGKPAGDGAGDGKPGEGAGKGAFDATAFAGSVGEAREALVAELGDLEVAPAADGEPAVTFKDLAKEYPAITNAMVAVVQRLTAPMREQFEQQQYAAGRERLLGEVEGRIPGAREIAGSPEFGAWYGAQPEAVKALGTIPDASAAAKLLRLYLAEHPEAAGKGGTDADGGGRRGRLGFLAAGGAERGTARTERGAARIERAGESELVDEDEAEGLFNELVRERRSGKAGV